MPVKQTLGRLKLVQLREAWESEPRDFTPWLAEEDNIQLLGEAIGIELEVEAQEKSVGPFRADILCKDTANDQWVLVENQLERTDHTHLGQLITYAAGLDTVTIVWISQRFTEEHRAALDWLNSVTNQEIRFFGLQVELWRIGDSPIAPRFHVISSPNRWSREVTRGKSRIAQGPATPGQDRQNRFWASFEAYLEQRECLFQPGRRVRERKMQFGLGRTGTQMSGKVLDRENLLRAEVRTTGRNAETFFNQLLAQQDEIANELGESVEWRAEEGNNRKQIILNHAIDLADESRWPEYCRWLHEKLNILYRVFAPRVRRLHVGSMEVDSEE